VEITPYNFSYANFIPKPDRRQQNLPVGVDRRSGTDRREIPRYILAPGQDIVDVDPNTQFIRQTDRRSQNLAVDTDRRTGVDRRQDPRFVPLSFNGSKAPENTIFIGNIISQDIPALKDFCKSFDSKAAGKLNQPVFDTFNYSNKIKDPSINLNQPPPVNQSSATELKQNIVKYLSNSQFVLKKTAEVFAAITTIVVGTESMRRLYSTIIKKN